MYKCIYVYMYICIYVFIYGYMDCDFSIFPDATLPGVFRLDMQPHVFQPCLHASACPITVATTFQAQEGVLIHGEARKKGICALRALGWAIGEYPALWVQPFVAEASNSFICSGDKQQSFWNLRIFKGPGALHHCSIAGCILVSLPIVDISRLLRALDTS